MIPPGSAEADSHGTSICSLIFGRDPVRGLAPGCSGLVLPLFFRGPDAEQSRPVSQLDLARAIAFGLEAGVCVFNISAGQKSGTTETESHLSQVIQQSVERRVLLVAAAGNDGCACIHLPAGVEFVLSVGALGTAGKPLAASNWAEVYRQNGLLAPGENLPVAIPGGGVRSGSGTSFATAVVSAVAGLLLSVARREGYRLDPLDIRHILIDSAAPCELEGDGACDRYLAGTLDAAAALAMVHRTGAARGSIAALAACGGQLVGTDKSEQQFADLMMGGLVMSNSSSVDAATVEPLGLSPSACNCQQKPDEETLKATVQPLGQPPGQPQQPAPNPSPPLAPVLQSTVVYERAQSASLLMRWRGAPTDRLYARCAVVRFRDRSSLRRFGSGHGPEWFDPSQQPDRVV